MLPYLLTFFLNRARPRIKEDNVFLGPIPGHGQPLGDVQQPPRDRRTLLGQDRELRRQDRHLLLRGPRAQDGQERQGEDEFEDGVRLPNFSFSIFLPRLLFLRTRYFCRSPCRWPTPRRRRTSDTKFARARTESSLPRTPIACLTTKFAPRLPIMCPCSRLLIAK